MLESCSFLIVFCHSVSKSSAFRRDSKPVTTPIKPHGLYLILSVQFPDGESGFHRGRGNLPSEANHLDPITGVYVKFVDKKYYILNNNAKELLENDGKHKEAAEKLDNSKPIQRSQPFSSAGIVF